MLVHRVLELDFKGRIDLSQIVDQEGGIKGLAGPFQFSLKPFRATLETVRRVTPKEGLAPGFGPV